MDDSNVSQVSLSTVLSQRAYMLIYSKKEFGDSQAAVAKAIKTFPTPPLSPINGNSKNLSTSKTGKNSIVSEPIKNSCSEKHQKQEKADIIFKAQKIKEPEPIVSKSGKNANSGKQVVKNLEKLAEGVNCNSTSNSWKVFDKNHSSHDICKSKKRNNAENEKPSSKSSLLPASLPELMQHFSSTTGKLKFTYVQL